MPLLVRCVRFVFGVFTVVRPSARSVFNFNRGIHKRSLGDCCSVAVPTGRERRELTCNACSFATIPGLIKPGPKASCSGQILYISACCASLQSFVAQCLQSHGGHPERLLGNGENEAVPNVPVVKTCFTVGVEGCAMFETFFFFCHYARIACFGQCQRMLACWEQSSSFVRNMGGEH